MKFVLISGGVLSGVGKGVIASSIGVLLRAKGFRVTAIKIDPYINIDAGTISPFEHGEVFVLNDGGEVDLDLGCYERFLDIQLTRDNNLTTGKIYKHVIEKERRGDYLGQTVQVVPHITNAIKAWIEQIAESYDICIIELGGTVGDMEQAPFIEALRQMQWDQQHIVVSVHVSLIPIIHGEQKTKPTQASVKQLRTLGITPDMIVCRIADRPLDEIARRKISSFCQVPIDSVISVHNVSNIYHVPLLLRDQIVADLILDKFKMLNNACMNLTNWIDLANRVDRIENQQHQTTIAIVGKYTGLTDSYISIVKALKHASYAVGHKITIKWVDSEKQNVIPQLIQDCDGILIPGGFGNRGVSGMIDAAQYARVKRIPYLGICLGLQIAIIEYARNVLLLANANSTEFDKDTQHPVIVNMPEISDTYMGGTMRLGSRSTNIIKDSIVYNKDDRIQSRHRHRYEVNPDYIEQLTNVNDRALRFVGYDMKGERVEVIEYSTSYHPFFCAVQFHPEFDTSPLKPSKIFVSFIEAILSMRL